MPRRKESIKVKVHTHTYTYIGGDVVSMMGRVFDGPDSQMERLVHVRLTLDQIDALKRHADECRKLKETAESRTAAINTSNASEGD